MNTGTDASLSVHFVPLRIAPNLSMLLLRSHANMYSSIIEFLRVTFTASNSESSLSAPKRNFPTVGSL